MASKRFVTFMIDDQMYGIEVLLVREINHYLDLTPVQNAPEFVCGLINLRGQIVTVIDLGVRLGLPPRTLGKDSHNIVLKTNAELAPILARENRNDLVLTNDKVGFIVDAIRDVVEADTAEIESAPANMGTVEGHHISGVLKLDGELLVLLNMGEVLKNEKKEN